MKQQICQTKTTINRKEIALSIQKTHKSQLTLLDNTGINETIKSSGDHKLIVKVQVEEVGYNPLFHFSLDNFSTLDKEVSSTILDEEQCHICQEQDPDLDCIDNSLYLHTDCRKALVREVRELVNQNRAEITADTI